MLVILVLTLVFVFVKQNTAYERRSSDWSSDVCSSDLGARDRRPRRAGLLQLLPQRRCREQRGRPAARGDAPPRLAGHGRRRHHQAAGGRRARGRPRGLLGQGDGGTPGDRKSVVSGKSVYGRVDLGGPPLLKKKMKRRKQYESISRN